jgi:hypothetical protein
MVLNPAFTLFLLSPLAVFALVLLIDGFNGLQRRKDAEKHGPGAFQASAENAPAAPGSYSGPERRPEWAIHPEP